MLPVESESEVTRSRDCLASFSGCAWKYFVKGKHDKRLAVFLLMRFISFIAFTHTRSASRPSLPLHCLTEGRLEWPVCLTPETEFKKNKYDQEI